MIRCHNIGLLDVRYVHFIAYAHINSDLENFVPAADHGNDHLELESRPGTYFYDADAYLFTML